MGDPSKFRVLVKRKMSDLKSSGARTEVVSEDLGERNLMENPKRSKNPGIKQKVSKQSDVDQSYNENVEKKKSVEVVLSESLEEKQEIEEPGTVSSYDLTVSEDEEPEPVVSRESEEVIDLTGEGDDNQSELWSDILRF